MDLVFAGKLDPVIDSVFPWRKPAAQEKLEQGQQLGKIVLEVG
jgi:NADPH:quinone reductase-like Zn-dependent oxidoreductase